MLILWQLCYIVGMLAIMFLAIIFLANIVLRASHIHAFVFFCGGWLRRFSIHMIHARLSKSSFSAAAFRLILAYPHLECFPHALISTIHTQLVYGCDFRRNDFRGQGVYTC
jgi:hypothetical protein